MQNSKLITLLKSLNKQELIDFQEIVDSPYFNKNKEVQAFVKILCIGITKNQKEPEKEEVFKKIYNHQNFEARKISDLTYITTNLFELFLAMENIKNDDILMKIKLLPEARSKNLNRVLISTYQDLQDLQKEYLFKNEDLALNNYLLNKEQLLHYIQVKSNRRNQAITNKQYYLNAFYVTAKLKLYAQAFRYSVKDSTEPVVQGLDEVLKILENQPDILYQFTSANIYRNILNLYLKPEEEKFFYDVLYIEESDNKHLLPEDLKDIYKHLIDYCYFKIQSGDNKFQFELFKLETKRLNLGLAYTENYLSGDDFERIFNLALTIGEFAYASDFLQNYRPKLPIEVKNDVYHFCLANYYYETKNPNKAIKSIKNHTFEIEKYSIDSKILLMKIYYEMEEDKSFNELIDKLTHQVNHSKTLKDEAHDVYLSIIKYSKKLYHLQGKLPYQRDRNYKKQVQNLKAKLEVDSQLTQYNWLSQKLIELALD